MKLLCLPSAPGNPYQSMMYAAVARHHDIIYAGPGGLSQLEDSAIGILHLHWDDRLFGRSRDPAAEAATLAAARASITGFQARGGRVIWTVHNREPHKITDLKAFETGRQMIVDLADAIHVHAPHARDHIVSAYGADPAKLHILPHPSYLAAYEPAETTLNRPFPEASVRQFLFFGMFRGQKGVHRIRDVAGKLTKRQVPYHLKMYGKAFGSQARMLRILGSNPNIDLRTDRIPDTEIPQIFASSQVFLAPYDSLFTSGSIMLALTFGLPVIGPDLRELRETTPEACHPLFYDPAAPRGLIRAMRRYIEMDDTDLATLRQACLDFAQDRTPHKISDQFYEKCVLPPKT